MSVLKNNDNLIDQCCDKCKFFDKNTHLILNDFHICTKDESPKHKQCYCGEFEECSQ